MRPADFTLENAQGLRVRLMRYGAAVTSIELGGVDVVLGFDSLEEYERAGAFGATCGRYANRIAHGCFEIDGTSYQVTRNEGAHHLHGGTRGFHRVLWDAEPVEDGVEFRTTSRDGEEGYPGTVSALVRYRLDDAGALSIDYRAECDRPTPINLTHHSYFNLAGTGDILQHELQIAADHVLPVDADKIPTGELLAVEGTPFDFRTAKPVGRAYDHCFALGGNPPEPRLVARLVHPSGRSLEVLTTEPGLQLYTGNHIANRGLCLECQRFPDAPNRPDFGPWLLRPGEFYRQTTVYRFNHSTV